MFTLYRPGGRGAWGLQLDPGRTPGTVYASKVVVGSVAEGCGVRVLDQIVSIDGRPVFQMRGQITAYFANSVSERIVIEVVPHYKTIPPTRASLDRYGKGIQLVLSRKKIKSTWGLKLRYNPIGDFILVSDVVSKSAAAVAGVMPGDKVIAIGDDEIGIGQTEQQVAGILAAITTLNVAVTVTSREHWSQQGHPPAHQGGTMHQGSPGFQNGFPQAHPVPMGIPVQAHPMPGQHPVQGFENPAYASLPPAPGSAEWAADERRRSGGAPAPVYEDADTLAAQQAQLGAGGAAPPAYAECHYDLAK